VAVLIVYNPRSGRAQARLRAEAAAAALRREGIEPALAAVGDELVASPELARGRGFGALVVAGGDGTFTSMIPHAQGAGPALYHLPSGNENLFARELGHSARGQTLVAAVRETRTARMDAMRVEGWTSARVGAVAGVTRTAALMVTLGPDASVIDRLAGVSAQTRSLGHLAYTRPVLDEMHEPHFPRARVWVDGREVVAGDAPGHLVIANSRAYALGIDPCWNADPFDGLLDVCFAAQGTPGEHLTSLVGHRLRADWLTGGVVRARGALVEVDILSGPAPVQMDGEQFAPVGVRSLRIEVLAAHFGVLLGPGRGDPGRGASGGSSPA
jgi:diacylglycerol kinase family enzyme